MKSLFQIFGVLIFLCIGVMSADLVAAQTGAPQVSASVPAAMPSPNASPSPQASDVASSAVEQEQPNPPTWALDLFKSAQDFVVAKFPKAGPVVAFIFNLLAIIAAAMTAVSGFLISLAKALEIGGMLTGKLDWVTKVNSAMDKIIYYAKYLSLFNAKKPGK